MSEVRTVITGGGPVRGLRVGREPSGVVWLEVGASGGSPPVRIRLSPDVAFKMCRQLLDLMGMTALTVPKGKVMPLSARRRADEPIAEEE